MSSLTTLMMDLGNGVGIDALADALLNHEGMQLIIPAKELQRAKKANEQPKITYVMQTDDGQVPMVFTSSEIAHDWALENGWVKRGAGTACITKPWVDGLRDFLWRGDVGLIIDQGSDHRLNFDQKDLMNLFAALSTEWMAGCETLYLLTVKDSSFTK